MPNHAETLAVAGLLAANLLHLPLHFPLHLHHIDLLFQINSTQCLPDQPWDQSDFMHLGINLVDAIAYSTVSLMTLAAPADTLA